MSGIGSNATLCDVTDGRRKKKKNSQLRDTAHFCKRIAMVARAMRRQRENPSIVISPAAGRGKKSIKGGTDPTAEKAKKGEGGA